MYRRLTTTAALLNTVVRRAADGMRMKLSTRGQRSGMGPPPADLDRFLHEWRNDLSSLQLNLFLLQKWQQAGHSRGPVNEIDVRQSIEQSQRDLARMSASLDEFERRNRPADNCDDSSQSSRADFVFGRATRSRESMPDNGPRQRSVQTSAPVSSSSESAASFTGNLATPS